MGDQLSQGRYVHRTAQTQNKPDLHASSGIKTHNPSVDRAVTVNGRVMIAVTAFGNSLLTWGKVRVRVKVKVTLRPTASQSVCLGVEPNLGLLTRYSHPPPKLRSCLCGAPTVVFRDFYWSRSRTFRAKSLLVGNCRGTSVVLQ
jgi:hypothetical protein